ncbi:cytochrome P450 [Boletus reticuloceps]|uniref:Cytochrome P450 n=1 Tax=Boletus reticuloceps TaxID=495285 RepID=A0A8I2YFB5_9AGAM|nr:cytochrome P450 [Boletus reticuloceps]
MQALVAVGVVVVSALTLLKRRRRTVHGYRLPPGPAPLPLVGNLFSIDGKRPWITYAEWATRYGDIFMIRVLKQDIIVINSEKTAKDLLDRRSSIYSDRPYIATRDPYGWSFNFGWSQYGDQWRSQRRMFHQAFRIEAALAFRPVQLEKARHLVLDILSAPHDFSKHIQKFSAAVIMSIVYDYEVAPEHDHLVELFERGNALAMESLTPEASSIVDAFPFVLSLPEWFPGAVLKRKAIVSKKCATQMIAEPFEYARQREALGSTASAVALDLLRSTKDVDDLSQLQLLKETCATAFVAGAETTTTTLQCFMLAMLQHPEVQGRAQAEIDAVIDTDRLPNFDDRPNLPYVEAILMETLRMYTVIPLGLPHATTADDIYGDILIPKGSTVVANVWAMYHNEDVYPEPDAFKPERFFVDGKLNGDKSTDSLVFGFGRRVCPGRYTADNSVWAAMVLILCTLKIAKARGEQGEELDFEPTFSYGVTTAPDPFPCSITPRPLNVDIHKLSSADLFE